MKKVKIKERAPVSLTDEDKAFADILSTEFKVDKELVESLFSDIRFALSLNVNEIHDLTFGTQRYTYFYHETIESLQKTLEYLQDKSRQVKHITISTVSGNIKITNNSILFRHFNSSLQYIEEHCQKELTYRTRNSPHKILIEKIGIEVLHAIHNSWLMPKFNKCILAGKVLLHFKIDHYETLLTEEKFYESTIIAAPNYYAYLYDVMKSRFKAVEKIYAAYYS